MTCFFFFFWQVTFFLYIYIYVCVCVCVCVCVYAQMFTNIIYQRNIFQTYRVCILKGKCNWFYIYSRCYTRREIPVSFISLLKATFAGNDWWVSTISWRWAEKHRYRMMVHGERKFKKISRLICTVPVVELFNRRMARENQVGLVGCWQGNTRYKRYYCWEQRSESWVM